LEKSVASRLKGEALVDRGKMGPREKKGYAPATRGRGRTTWTPMPTGRREEEEKKGTTTSPGEREQQLTKKEEKSYGGDEAEDVFPGG